MTGASSGIGIETARALAATGGRCFLGVRSLEKGKQACGDFLEPGRVELLEIDTSSLASVRKAAETFLSKSKTLNVLIANAGIMACPEARTADGFESQFATNFVGHFLLFQLLKDALLAGATPEHAARVVNVSSSGHQASGVHFGNLALEGEYAPWTGYGQSKTAMIYMTNELDRRYGARGLHGLALMPGGIITPLQKHLPQEVQDSWSANEDIMNFMKSPAQGAATTLSAALGREWEGTGGKYLEDCAEAKPVVPGSGGSAGVAPHAFDEEKEKRLWTEACKMVGVPE